MNSSGKRGGWFFLLPIVFVILIFLAADSKAQFQEQRAWQFQDPFQGAFRLNRATARELYKGKFFEGSHASRVIQIGEVQVDHASGNLTLTDQSNTSIGNVQNVTQDGNGNLTIDSEATSGTQTNTNTNDITRQDSPNSICLNCGG